MYEGFSRDERLIGKENFSPNIDAAIEKAEKITSNR